MKILTYNLWNSEQGMPERILQIIHVLKEQEADIWCLQEVSHDMASALQAAFPDMHVICNAESGIMLMSKFGAELVFDSESGIAALLDTPDGKIAVANVHLPWQSALRREQAIVKITEALEELKAVMTLCAGDFNCTPKSAVQQYMTGEQSLNGSDAYYFDLAESAEAAYGIPAEATLDFRENPRWHGCNTLECNQRVDRILLKNAYPAALPRLEDFGVFGKEKSDETAFCPSDHYGVYAVLSL